MDVTQALRDAENSLRDFIASVLPKALGVEWLDKVGVSPERQMKWRARKESESRRQETGVVEERLLYYADFFDLKTILKIHWAGEFSQALGDWKTFEVLLTELERLRDPDAHRRELLPHQKHLILGISGEIRTRIVRYRSRKETFEDHFPRIESARDSLGNIWVPDVNIWHLVQTEMTVRQGDKVDFVITARDPEDKPLRYGIGRNKLGFEYQDSNEFSHTFNAQDIGRLCSIELVIQSSRTYHARTDHDDHVNFHYSVLPRQD